MNDRERHRQFIERLDRSRPATFRAAEWLHKKGYNITIPAIQYRPFEEAPDKYLDSGDMFIEKDGKTYRVEINTAAMILPTKIVGNLKVCWSAIRLLWNEIKIQ